MTRPTSKPEVRLSHLAAETWSGDQLTADCAIIEIRLREVSQLFNSLDPSPFHERELDDDANEYIVDSAKELPAHARFTLITYIDQPASNPEEGRVLGDAVRVHFVRRTQLLRRDLRQLIRRGRTSLVIGLTFLSAVFGLVQLVVWLMKDNAWTPLLREGLLIVGWVAMWKPLEIFLYDWWPIVGEHRIHDRLSRIKVRIVYGSDAQRT